MCGTSPHLDGQYTAWGQVIEGMRYVDGIQKGPADQNGSVPVDMQDSMVKVVVAADVAAKAD